MRFIIVLWAGLTNISVLYIKLRDSKNNFRLDYNNFDDIMKKAYYIVVMSRKGLAMAIRYNKLWKRLIDEKMMKVDLRDQAGITTNALAKLGKNEHVSTAILEKVCNVLHCNIEDIMEFVLDEEGEEK